MAVKFPDEIHPKYGYKLRFEFKNRGIDYLTFFKIIKISAKCMFIPLNLTFESYEQLKEFLTNRGIISLEFRVSDFYPYIKETVSIVDTSKIYDVEESISKYLLNYKYYSINEVAEMLSFSRPTVYKLVNEKTLKACRINGQFRINHLDLMEFINNKEYQS